MEAIQFLSLCVFGDLVSEGCEVPHSKPCGCVVQTPANLIVYIPVHPNLYFSFSIHNLKISDELMLAEEYLGVRTPFCVAVERHILK